MKINEKRTKTENNSNSDSGFRLRECREYRNLTQERLAELLGLSPNYISMLERKERPIDWDKAIQFANILNVSPAFIMCKTDIMNIVKDEPTLDLDTYGTSDLLLMQFLIAAGHYIIFHVIKLYDGKQPTEKDFHGHKYIDWRSLHINASLNDLRDFCLSDAHCKLQTEENISEVIIHEVLLDGTVLSFGQFAYFINRMYDYINFSIDELNHFKDDFASQSAQDCMITDELKDAILTKHHKFTPSDSLKSIMKEYPNSTKLYANSEEQYQLYVKEFGKENVILRIENNLPNK